MSLLGLYDRSLLGRAATPALDASGLSGEPLALTFGALEERSNRVAHALRARGVQAGDRLAFYLTNRVEIIDLWLACIKTGIIVVPVNVLYREREIAHIVSDSAPVAVITTAAQQGDLPAGVPSWSLEALSAEAAQQSAVRITAPCVANTPAALVYTSGTTGASKGAVLTHGNFAANALALTASWEFTGSDRYLAVLPLFHVHGLANGLHVWLLSGCHMRLAERFEHERAADWFEAYQPTVFFGVPTMFVRLLDVAPARAAAIGARARLFVSGSAPLPAPVMEAFRERFGHVILERYGMTETLMNVSNPFYGERRPGTVGFPMPMTVVRIVDEAGADVPDGTSGELWVRGPNVCDGYWRRPDATAAAFADGWFRTGVVGVRAADGYITLEGRRSDLIISGGFNIYPSDIEAVLLTLPGVVEAAVVGVASDAWGETPVAFIVAPGADPEPLRTAANAKVGKTQRLAAVVLVDELPRSHIGKVLKRELRDSFTGTVA